MCEDLPCSCLCCQEGLIWQGDSAGIACVYGVQGGCACVCACQLCCCGHGCCVHPFGASSGACAVCTPAGPFLLYNTSGTNKEVCFGFLSCKHQVSECCCTLTKRLLCRCTEQLLAWQASLIPSWSCCCTQGPLTAFSKPQLHCKNHPYVLAGLFSQRFETIWPAISHAWFRHTTAEHVQRIPLTCWHSMPHPSYNNITRVCCFIR